jgi:hypothetical protein
MQRGRGRAHHGCSVRAWLHWLGWGAWGAWGTGHGAGTLLVGAAGRAARASVRDADALRRRGSAVLSVRAPVGGGRSDRQQQPKRGSSRRRRGERAAREVREEHAQRHTHSKAYPGGLTPSIACHCCVCVDCSQGRGWAARAAPCLSAGMARPLATATVAGGAAAALAGERRARGGRRTGTRGQPLRRWRRLGWGAQTTLWL